MPMPENWRLRKCIITIHPGWSGKGIFTNKLNQASYIYLENFNTMTNSGRKFSMEKFEDGKLVSKLFSDEIRWDSIKNKWHIRNYYIRDFNDESADPYQGQRYGYNDQPHTRGIQAKG